MNAFYLDTSISCFVLITQKNKYHITSHNYNYPLSIGAFGFTCLAIDSKYAKVAVSFVKKASLDRDKILQEIQTLSAITSLQDSRNLLTLIDWSEDKETAFLVTPHFEHGTLTSVISKGMVHSEQDAVEFIRQLCYGLRILHSNSMVHRNLKTDNILVNSSSDTNGTPALVLAIADYGITKEITECTKSSSTFTRAPESYGGSCEYASDIYSIGCIFYKLLMNNDPFEGSSDNEIYEKKMRPTVNITCKLSKTSLCILEGCLQYDPSRRMPKEVLYSALKLDSLYTCNEKLELGELVGQNFIGLNKMSLSRDSDSAAKLSPPFLHKSKTIMLTPQNTQLHKYELTKSENAYDAMLSELYNNDAFSSKLRSFDIITLKEKISKLQERIETGTIESVKAQYELKDKDKQILDLGEKLALTNNAKAKLEKELDHSKLSNNELSLLKIEEAALKDKNRDLIRENGVKDDTISQLQKQIDDLSSKLSIELNTQDKQISTLNADNLKYIGQIERYKQTIKVKEAELQKYESQKQIKDDQLVELNKELQSLRSELSLAKSLIEQKEKVIAENDNKTIQQIEHSNLQIVKLKASIEQLLAENQLIQAKLQKSINENESKQSKMDEKDAAIKVASNKMKEISENYNKFKEESANKDRTISEGTALIEQLREQVAEYEALGSKAKEAADASAKEAKNQLIKKDEQIAKLQQELSVTKSKYAQFEKEAAKQRQITEKLCENVLKESNLKIEEKAMEVAKMVDEIAIKDSQIDSQNKEISKLSSKIMDLNIIVQSKDQLIEQEEVSALKDKEIMNATIDQMKELQVNKDEQMNALQEEVNKITLKCTSLEYKLNEKEISYKELNYDAKRLKIVLPQRKLNDKCSIIDNNKGCNTDRVINESNKSIEFNVSAELLNDLSFASDQLMNKSKENKEKMHIAQQTNAKPLNNEIIIPQTSNNDKNLFSSNLVKCGFVRYLGRMLYAVLTNSEIILMSTSSKIPINSLVNVFYSPIRNEVHLHYTGFIFKNKGVITHSDKNEMMAWAAAINQVKLNQLKI